jgi:hypothetical protein
VFVTKPLAPTGLRLDKDRPRGILFHKSMTPYVQRYKVRWRPLEETEGSADAAEAFVGAAAIQDGTDSLIRSFLFVCLFVWRPGRQTSLILAEANL